MGWNAASWPSYTSDTLPAGEEVTKILMKPKGEDGSSVPDSMLFYTDQSTGLADYAAGGGKGGTGGALEGPVFNIPATSGPFLGINLHDCINKDGS